MAVANAERARRHPKNRVILCEGKVVAEIGGVIHELEPLEALAYGMAIQALALDGIRDGGIE